MRLLIVDDDPVIRRLLQATLTRAGHQVEQAPDGRAAWELLQSDPIKLVITDWMMPERDGPALIRLIRETPTPHYTYIILLTAKGEKDDIIGGLETGADDYLIKPFHPGELRARVGIGERILDLQARLKESHDQLEILATHDGLTGLLNRRAIQEQLDAEWKRTGRGNRPLSILLLDIDHFKSVNDQHGHAIGDQALRLIAETLAAGKRVYDWAGRWGGEEFLLALPETDLRSAGMIAERMREKVTATPLVLPDGTRVDLTVSLGVASAVSGLPATLDLLLQQADQALYSAKRLGRNQVCLYEERPSPVGPHRAEPSR